MMNKMLRTRDRLLMVAALFGDITFEAYFGGAGPYRKTSFLESIINAQPHSFRSALSRSLKAGEIEKVVNSKGQACYRLSRPGQQRFTRLYPISQLRNKIWDKRWRIVIFDIPEKERKYRDQLRVDLTSLGFGKLQESIYISPLDILVDLQDMLRAKGYAKWVIVFEAEQKLVGAAIAIVAMVWPIDQLNKEYNEMLDEISWQKSNPPTAEKKSELRSKFYDLLSKDPFLPREMLPDNWKGDLVQKEMLQYG